VSKEVIIRTLFKIGIALFVLLSGGTVIAQDYRIVLTVDNVIALRDDTLVTVPVYISHPGDSIAGMELYFKIDPNRNFTFAMDDIRLDGLWMAADTSGTIMSGWEWMGITSLEDGLFDLKVSGMADWPNKKVTPPAPPGEGDLLVKLLFRFDGYFPIADDSVFTIKVIPEKSGFSDPKGYSIGVVTKIERVCREYQGDSCLSWKRIRTGYLDTAIVKFNDGSITVVDSLGIGR
jgi:hypothetical protein